MAVYTIPQLLTRISTYIKTNGNKDITGSVLQSILTDVVDSLNAIIGPNLTLFDVLGFGDDAAGRRINLNGSGAFLEGVVGIAPNIDALLSATGHAILKSGLDVVKLRNVGDFDLQMFIGNLTANRQITWPDKPMTVAGLDDITASLGLYLLLDGTSPMTGDLDMLTNNVAVRTDKVKTSLGTLELYYGASDRLTLDFSAILAGFGNYTQTFRAKNGTIAHLDDTFCSGDNSLSSNRTISQGSFTLAFTSSLVNAFNLGSNAFSVDTLNKRIGLNITNPSYQLHMIGDLGIGMSSTTGGFGTGWFKPYTPTHLYWEIGDNSGQTFRWGGNYGTLQDKFGFLGSGGVGGAVAVGIGLFNPSAALDVLMSDSNYVSRAFLFTNSTGGVVMEGRNDRSVGIGVGPVTDAFLKLQAVSTTKVPLLFESAGTLKTTPLSGAMEYVGNFYYLTANALRHSIATYGRTEVNAATYPIVSTDRTVGVVYTATGVVTITMPAASNFPAGYEITIKDEGGNAGTNNITINRNGTDTLDGVTTELINSDYQSRTYYSNGVNGWFNK